MILLKSMVLSSGSLHKNRNSSVPAISGLDQMSELVVSSL